MPPPSPASTRRMSTALQPDRHPPGRARPICTPPPGPGGRRVEWSTIGLRSTRDPPQQPASPPAHRIDDFNARRRGNDGHPIDASSLVTSGPGRAPRAFDARGTDPGDTLLSTGSRPRLRPVAVRAAPSSGRGTERRARVRTPRSERMGHHRNANRDRHRLFGIPRSAHTIERFRHCRPRGSRFESTRS